MIAEISGVSQAVLSRVIDQMERDKLVSRKPAPGDNRAVEVWITGKGRQLLESLMLAPIGAQQRLSPEGELATARAAASRGHALIASTMTNYDVEEISEAYGAPVWFQLYASPDRELVKHLLGRAASAGSPVVALTVDSPTLGNRERQIPFAAANNSRPRFRLGNFEGYNGPPRIGDPSLT